MSGAARRVAEVLPASAGGMSQPRRSDQAIVLPDAMFNRIGEGLSRYCEERIPPHVRDMVRLEWAAHESIFTLTERRPHFMRRDEWTHSDVAQFRYDVESGEWTLLLRDRNSTWHEYGELAPSTDFETLLAEVDNEPTGIF